MKDWNVVVTVYQDGYTRVLHALEKLGTVDRSPYYNVLAMTVDDPVALLEALERQTDEDPALYDAISRIAPATERFSFISADDFKAKARAILQVWSKSLTGRTFHARLHRRGEADELPSPEIERFIDDQVIAATNAIGQAASVSFNDPDAVIAIDTIDDQAGFALWTREDLARHRLLRPD
jgi:tRNA(Ser,Leu) C12 N-acetylase TAN1